jgi:hypothetical protein
MQWREREQRQRYSDSYAFNVAGWDVARDSNSTQAATPQFAFNALLLTVIMMSL